MIVLADVVMAGLWLFTVVFLPFSLACSLTLTSFLSGVPSMRRPWSILAGLLLSVLAIASLAVFLLTASTALSFALPAGAKHPWFDALYSAALIAFTVLHYAVYRLSRNGRNA